MKKSYFTKDGNWYKGNLHTHSTMSDGEATPEERIAGYKAHGYSFLALTDHNVYGAYPEKCTDDFLILPGTERDIFDSSKKRYSTIHAVGISRHEESESLRTQLHKYTEENPKMPWQDLINEMKSQDQFVVIAHPAWSRMCVEDLMSLEGNIGMEIYNNTCERRWHAGYSDFIIDYCMRLGKKALLFATDDAHKDDNLETYGGWIQVKAKELTHKEIIRQIEAGNFYASMGPEIYDFGIEDGYVYLECSPCEEIHFVAYERLGENVIQSGITQAKFKLDGDECFVRCECVDKNGKTAYTNPIYFF